MRIMAPKERSVDTLDRIQLVLLLLFCMHPTSLDGHLDFIETYFYLGIKYPVHSIATNAIGLIFKLTYLI